MTSCGDRASEDGIAFSAGGAEEGQLTMLPDVAVGDVIESSGSTTELSVSVVGCPFPWSGGSKKFSFAGKEFPELFRGPSLVLTCPGRGISPSVRVGLETSFKALQCSSWPLRWLRTFRDWHNAET